MERVKNGLDTVSDISRIVNAIPAVSTLLSPLLNDVRSIRETFNRAYTTVRQIDGAAYRHKSVAMTAVQNADTGIHQ